MEREEGKERREGPLSLSSAAYSGKLQNSLIISLEGRSAAGIPFLKCAELGPKPSFREEGEGGGGGGALFP